MTVVSVRAVYSVESCGLFPETQLCAWRCKGGWDKRSRDIDGFDDGCFRNGRDVDCGRFGLDQQVIDINGGGLGQGAEFGRWKRNSLWVVFYYWVKGGVSEEEFFETLSSDSRPIQVQRSQLTFFVAPVVGDAALAHPLLRLPPQCEAVAQP